MEQNDNSKNSSIEMKKYELIPSDKRGLYRVKALRDFADVNKGEIGGYIESEENLSNNGDAWVYGTACVTCNARVYGDAWVYGTACVTGNARVYGDARVYGTACVTGNARVYGDAHVTSVKDYIVFKNWWSSGRFFTWTRSNDMWAVGCFYGTGRQLIAKAYEDSQLSGREYERIVDYVDKIKE